MLAAIQLMQAGNIYGIPYSALVSRFNGKPYQDSSWMYELGMHVGGLVLFPIALMHGLIRWFMGFSTIRLDNSAAFD